MGDWKVERKEPRTMRGSGWCCVFQEGGTITVGQTGSKCSLEKVQGAISLSAASFVLAPVRILAIVSATGLVRSFAMLK